MVTKLQQQNSSICTFDKRFKFRVFDNTRHRDLLVVINSEGNLFEWRKRESKVSLPLLFVKYLFSDSIDPIVFFSMANSSFL